MMRKHVDFSSDIKTKALILDLSELKAGIYFVSIHTEEGSLVKKIIKE